MFDFESEICEDGIWRISKGPFKGCEVFEYNGCPKTDLNTLTMFLCVLGVDIVFSPGIYMFFAFETMHIGRWMGFLAFVVFPQIISLIIAKLFYLSEKHEAEAYEERKRRRAEERRRQEELAEELEREKLERKGGE